MTTGEAVTALRARADELEASIKEARGALDAIRAVVSELDVARATAEADLSHLAHTCEDAVNATLDEVVVEVDQLERDGQATPDAAVVLAEEPDEDEVGRAGPRTRDAMRPTDSDVRLSRSDGGDAARAERRRSDRRAARQDRAARAGQHDGDRAVRRARDAPRVPHHAAQGPDRVDRPDQRGDQAHRRDDAHALRRGVRGDQHQLPADLQHAVRRRPRRV